MAKPEIHAESSAKKHGGKMTDYLDIHQMMDSSKAAYPNNLHRVVFHHAFGCFIIEKMFGIDLEGLSELQKKHRLSDDVISDIVKWKEGCIEKGKSRLNSDGVKYSVRDIAEQHCYEDFRNRFIPTLQDYIEDCNIPGWVNNGLGVPNRLIKKEDTSVRD